VEAIFAWDTIDFQPHPIIAKRIIWTSRRHSFAVVVPVRQRNLVGDGESTAGCRAIAAQSHRKGPNGEVSAKHPEGISLCIDLDSNRALFSRSSRAYRAHSYRLRLELGRSLGAPGEALRDDLPLDRAGVDSLVALDLTQRVQEELGVELSRTRLLEGVSLIDLALELARAVEGESASSDADEELLAELAELDDHELKRLLDGEEADE